MIELKLVIEDVDYISLADTMSPMLIDRINSENMPGWIKMMLVGSGMNTEGVKKLMSHFSENKLEGMAVNAINKNNGKAAEFFEDMAKKQGINISIKEIEAKQL